jgi:nicotinamidase-related amidase
MTFLFDSLISHKTVVQPQNPSKRAILVIDIQFDFTGPDARMPVDKQQAQHMIESVNDVVDRASELDLLVVYIGNEYSKVDLLNLFRHFAAIRDTPGALLDSRLHVVSDHYFPKRKDNAFSNPALVQFLKEQHIETVILCGLYAEACIWSSLKGAQANGFRVEILSNSIATKTESKRQAMLKRYVQQGALLLEESFKI